MASIAPLFGLMAINCPCTLGICTNDQEVLFSLGLKRTMSLTLTISDALLGAPPTLLTLRKRRAQDIPDQGRVTLLPSCMSASRRELPSCRTCAGQALASARNWTR